MTAPVFAPSSEFYSSVGSLSRYRASQRLIDGKTPRLAARRSSSYLSGQKAASSFSACPSAVPLDVGAMWSSVLELLPQGVMVVSRSLKPIYWNSKAKEVCQTHMGVDLATANVPDSVAEACYRLIRDSAPNLAALFIRDGRSGNISLRISARWLVSASTPQSLSTVNPLSPAQQASETPTGFSVDQSFIVVFLENCDEVMEQEMRIQQKKYDLTEREAEVWILLRKEYTYQDIAKILQISLNTVKTHVKNIYAKRRSYQGEEKILVL